MDKKLYIAKYSIHQSQLLKDVLPLLNSKISPLLLVLDDEHKLVGTLTDGDVRRGILVGKTIQDTVATVMKRNPKFARRQTPPGMVQDLLEDIHPFPLPYVDDNGRIIDIQWMQQPGISHALPNVAVLMCGGLGTRMGSLTENCPKPMLPLYGKPILDWILSGLVKSGIEKFFLAVNYLSEMIEEYFTDGSQWGVQIEYIREEKRLGTAGALSLIPHRPEHPILVSNGDLLTRLDFCNILHFHNINESMGTMGIARYEFQNPYGVVRYDGANFLCIEEKPVSMCYVNAGIYVLDPQLLDLIPYNTFYDMPSLLSSAKDQGHRITVYPLSELWMDIGRESDLEKANSIGCQ
jgi:dTDP-glucose pyrophosphorylase